MTPCTDVQSVYFRFFTGQAAAVATELPELLRQDLEQMPAEYRGEFRILIAIDVGINGMGLPALAGLSPNAACFDLHMPDLADSFPSMATACARLEQLNAGDLHVAIGRFGPQEYIDMRKLTIYGQRAITRAIPDWLLMKNISRRAGRFGWLWNWFVQRFDDK